MKIKKSSLWKSAPLVFFLIANACAAGPAPVINKSTDKLISYFDAKRKLATTLQVEIGGQTSDGLDEGSSLYRLLPINGPSYQIGSILALNNSLELFTRKCVVEDEGIPYEPWSNLPRWSSNSNLDTELGVPAPFRNVIDTASLDAGLKLQSASTYEMADIGQRFFARDDLLLHTRKGDCGAYLKSLDEPVIFIRGIVYGRETLKSVKSVGTAANVRVLEGKSGQFSFKFDRSGAYELADEKAVPKFAILAKIVPKIVVRETSDETSDVSRPLIDSAIPRVRYFTPGYFSQKEQKMIDSFAFAEK